MMFARRGPSPENVLAETCTKLVTQINGLVNVSGDFLSLAKELNWGPENMCAELQVIAKSLLRFSDRIHRRYYWNEFTDEFERFMESPDMKLIEDFRENWKENLCNLSNKNESEQMNALLEWWTEVTGNQATRSSFPVLRELDVNDAGVEVVDVADYLHTLWVKFTGKELYTYRIPEDVYEAAVICFAAANLVAVLNQFDRDDWKRMLDDVAEQRAQVAQKHPVEKEEEKTEEEVQKTEEEEKTEEEVQKTEEEEKKEKKREHGRAKIRMLHSMLQTLDTCMDKVLHAC